MKWIRPQDELPEAKYPFPGGKYSDNVLICQDGAFYIAHLESYQPGEYSLFITHDLEPHGVEVDVEEVTCWAPIPKPPKEWLNDEEEPPA